MQNKLIPLLLFMTAPLISHASLTNVEMPLTKIKSASPLRFSPYADITINAHWNEQTGALEPQDLVSISHKANLKSLHIAFLVDYGHCKPAWESDTYYPLEWAVPLVKRLHQHQIETIISFGGANRVDLSKHCNKKQLIEILEKVTRLYSAKTFDFDIENGTANVANLLDALKEFQTLHPEMTYSLTLPTMPDGLLKKEQSIIEAAIEKNLRFRINIMTMNYGPAYTADMGKYAISAAKQLNNYLQTLYPNKNPSEIWSMIEITPMIGINDIETERFTLANARTLKEFAEKIGIKYLSMWSINRDRPCKEKFVRPTCSGEGMQKQAYDFSQTLGN